MKGRAEYLLLCTDQPEEVIRHTRILASQIERITRIVQQLLEFTRENRPGLFIEAEGGTLFLDEIAEMPLAIQPKILQALETGKVRPEGAVSEIATDVRIIAATNQPIEKALQNGLLRADLYYRLTAMLSMSLAELEIAYIRRILEMTQGNKVQAAKILGIDRGTLYRKLGDEVNCTLIPWHSERLFRRQR